MSKYPVAMKAYITLASIFISLTMANPLTESALVSSSYFLYAMLM